ncbi:dihydrofolate reductase family protein [Balneola sp. MJW-20]|uniref:dihydrofolate reductase family protein n=1 Tax=Gracilimonas aurantiaca TaxID=3234185 RepID=UPI0034662ED1
MTKDPEASKQSVFIACSMDGFIARLDGSIDWLDEVEHIDDEDYGFAEFMNRCDALVMGRNTFEKVLSFGEWPYGPKPVVVLSRSLKSLPESLPDTVHLLSGDPGEVIENLSERGWDQLYIDGGKTIQEFLNAGFIQEMVLSTIPVLIGEGLPLFGSLEQDLKWKVINSLTYSNGIIKTTYQLL